MKNQTLAPSFTKLFLVVLGLVAVSGVGYIALKNNINKQQSAAVANTSNSASGDRLLLMGGAGVSQVFNDIWSFDPVAISWTLISPNNPDPSGLSISSKWSTRRGPAAQYFNGNVWLLGGLAAYSQANGNRVSELWTSSNAALWKNILASTNQSPWSPGLPPAPWYPVNAVSLVVFKNKLWMSGDAANVWSSSNGTTWNKTASYNPPAPIDNQTPNCTVRVQSESLVFNGKLWLLGGQGSGVLPTADVCSSLDGINWKIVKQVAPWSHYSPYSYRFDFGAVVFNGKMWVMGGCNLFANGPGCTAANDIWSSSDGITWTQVAAGPHWSRRTESQTLVMDNKIWVIGGAGIGTSNFGPFNDVWSSPDGINWTQHANAPWQARAGAAATIVPANFKFGPMVTTGTSGSATQTSAILNASVNSQNNIGSVYIKYGTSPLAMTMTTPRLPLGSGTVPITISQSVTGLIPNGNYFYQACVTYGSANICDTVRDFITLP